jgi:DNA repair protein RadA/Sms
MARGPSFVCADCGTVFPQWVGKCSSCGAWGTIEEKGVGRKASASRTLQDVDGLDAARVPTGNGELDRVLGGGIVRGAVVLLSGEPGIGKSTVALQITPAFASTLYAAGEESPAQIRLRADRLGIDPSRVTVTTEPTAEAIAAEAERMRPSLLIVDSIQTVRVESALTTGAVNQIREAAAIILRAAKKMAIPAIVIGHVTKTGDIAGPMLLEHLVDVVLMLEQDASGAYRLLRGTKNRFGATDEVGLFAMTETGLREIANPSEILLPSGAASIPGSAVTASMEGRRPLLVELQALTVSTAFGLPRRLSTGIDPNRLGMLLAVIERRGGVLVSKDDVYLNSAGGFRLKEPAVDLAVIAAVASAVRDRAVPRDAVFCGEVGLGGEVRPVPRLDSRLREAAKLGFRKAFAPVQTLEAPGGLEVITVGRIEDLLCALP